MKGYLSLADGAVGDLRLEKLQNTAIPHRILNVFEEL